MTTFNHYLEEHFEDQHEVTRQDFGEYVDQVDHDILEEILHDHTYILLLDRFMQELKYNQS